MSTFYLDPQNGNDATTSTPLGWWSRTYTSGNGTQPTADMQATGGTSGQTAKVTVVTVTAGSWAGGNAAGTIYWYGMSGAFAAETLTFTNGATCAIAGAFTFCAWKTITSGATAARLGLGDIIRISKSPDPVKLSGATGKATWNNGNNLVTLAEAQTKDIDMCETAWTAAAGADVTVTRTANTASSGKQGSYHMRFLFDASVQNSILQAYFPLGSAQDFSAYQEVSYWITTDTAIAANNLRIALCSDTAGATPVDYIEFSSDIKANKWVAINTAKTGGGNLGASIQSIAIYTGSSAAALASRNVYIDCVIACKTDGLNLTTLISKNTLKQSTLSSANYGNEPWIAIQSISGTTLYLDRIYTTSPASTGTGLVKYGGSTELVDTYFRKTFKTTPLTSLTGSAAMLNDDGSEASPIQYQGGFDMATNLQDSDTIFDGSNNNGYGLNTNSKIWNTINRLSFVRYTNGIRNVGTTSPGVLLDTIADLNNNGDGATRDDGSNGGRINTLINACFNGTSGLNINVDWNIDKIGSVNSNQRGIQLGGRNRIRKVYTMNQCTQYGIYTFSSDNIVDEIAECDGCDYGGYFESTENLIKKFTITNSTTVDVLSAGKTSIIHKEGGGSNDAAGLNYSTNYLSISNRGGDAYIYKSLGYAYTQNATAGGSGKEWVLEPYYVVNAYSSLYRPFVIPIAKFAVASGSLVTISVYMKKSHATDIVAKLVCQGMQISGVDEDVESLCPSDTSRNQVSISFTPTESGVVQIEVSTYASVTASTVILDDISISQS